MVIRLMLFFLYTIAPLGTQALVGYDSYPFENQVRSYMIHHIGDEIIMGNLVKNVIYIEDSRRFVLYSYDLDSSVIDGWEIGDVLLAQGSVDYIVNFMNTRTHEEYTFQNVYMWGALN